MGIAERRLRQKEEVHASILKAAWQLVKDEGWQALSIRKIADAIEYSSPVIYEHFENKEAILLAFTRRGFQLLNKTLIKATDGLQKPEEQIEAIAYAYWGFAFKNKEYYQLMYGLGMPGCETVKQIDELKQFTGLVMAPITKLLEKSSNKENEAFLKLHTFWSMLHGLISINLNIIHKPNEHGDLNSMVLKDFIEGFIYSMKK